LNTGKRLHHKRNDTDTIQELPPISKKGLHLIDTFSASTGEKPERNLIPYFSRFSRTWRKKEHYYDTNTLGKIKTSAIYKPKTFFNKKNNCPIICDIYRKLLSLSIENKEINKPLKLVWLPV
jgi:hypothetical protein